MSVLRPLKKNNGVSLLEVLIATLIFSIAFLSFVSIQIGSLDTVRDGFVKKMVTDNGNDFITQMNTDLTSQKTIAKKKIILDYYLNEDWNISSDKCPLSGDYLTKCLKNDDLDDETICTKEERIKLTTQSFQCDLMQNIPSSKVLLQKCNETSALHCLTISWNGDDNDYDRCKAYDSSCLIFEVLP